MLWENCLFIGRTPIATNNAQRQSSFMVEDAKSYNEFMSETNLFICLIYTKLLWFVLLYIAILAASIYGCIRYSIYLRQYYSILCLWKSLVLPIWVYIHISALSWIPNFLFRCLVEYKFPVFSIYHFLCAHNTAPTPVAHTGCVVMMVLMSLIWHKRSNKPRPDHM